MKGFSLLEVMIALAIMAGVLVTVITSFNYHLTVAARDKEETDLVLLARGKLEELESLGAVPDKKEGKFADRPEIGWLVTKEKTQIPGINKLTVSVTGESKGRSISFVHYVPE